MKTKILLLAAMAATLAGLGSCSKDDDNGSGGGNGSDPEGTVMVSMRNRDNGDTRIYPTFDSYIYLELDQGNNLSVAGSDSFIASVGSVGGLAYVQNISGLGWAKKSRAIEGYGYVFKYYPSGYIRIYVVDAIIGTNGGILGYNIKYQAPFVP